MGVVLALASLAGACSLQGEPTERQMQVALETKFKLINANLISLAESCRNRDFVTNQNPLQALQCMQICAAAMNETCEVSFELTRFRKIACQKSPSEAGYVCDFEAGLATNAPYAQMALQTMIGGGTAGQGRFVRDDGQWTFMQLE
jgi:hypothetical protein